MPSAVQLLSDRLEIESLLTRYAWALDHKEFDGLDDVFTADAFIDYTSAGGIKGAFPEVKAWLAQVLPHFSAYQHLVTNKQVELDGDAATSVAGFYNPMVQTKPDGSTSTFFVGGEYHDKLVRTKDGWRIAERVEKTVWTDGVLPAEPPT
jgi:3-phenylpropionate/cinnamic acid dioxygenase small subunit